MGKARAKRAALERHHKTMGRPPKGYIMTRKSGRNTDGTFGPGNPGKPKGTRHKATQAVLALLDGDAERLTRQAVTMALEGDTTALRLCLERIAPPRKDVAVTFDLPRMEAANDAAKAAGAVLGAVANGELTPTEAAHIMALVETYRRTLETTEIEARIAALEATK
jgi:hypothetical protein